jgi:Glycosyltransferase sugar-binding region containing DXD motif
MKIRVRQRAMDVCPPYTIPNRIIRVWDPVDRASQCHCDYRFWFHVILFGSAIWFSLLNYYYFTTLFMLSGLPQSMKSIESLPYRQLINSATNNIDHASFITSSIGQPSHQKIPRILIFTHHINLLTKNLSHPSVSLTNATVNAVAAELQVLQDNVHSIVALHQEGGLQNSNTIDPTAVRFLTDEDCIQSIRQWALMSHQAEHAAMGIVEVEDDDPNAIAEELIYHFQNEPMGMFKADLCRGVALYETGGIYMDVDLGVRMNLFSILQPESEFTTIQVHPQSMYPGAFFQAMIAVTPQHDVIHRYIHLFLQHYRNQTQVNGPLGVLLLRRAYDEILHEQKAALYGELYTNTTTSVPTHLEKTTELWQEILYAPELQETILAHVPRPTWGRRRACRFVVVVPPRHEEESSTAHYPLLVPMYSRIAGSRMCPVDQ